MTVPDTHIQVSGSVILAERRGVALKLALQEGGMRGILQSCVEKLKKKRKNTGQW